VLKYNSLEEQIHNENSFCHKRNRSVLFRPLNFMFAKFRYWDCAGSQYGYVSGSCRKFETAQCIIFSFKGCVLRTKSRPHEYKYLFYSILFWLYNPLLGLGRFFSFLMYTWSVGLLGKGDQAVARPLPTRRTTQTHNKRTQTYMPRVEFEPTTPVFEEAKTVHALDGAATVIGSV
jgi:hypothetical protein